jgi:hypothetical protein
MDQEKHKVLAPVELKKDEGQPPAMTFSASKTE